MSGVRVPRTVVVGVGAIGASFAAALRRAGELDRVVGVGRGRANLETARAAGVVDEIGHDVAAAVATADLVVLAAPVDACVALLGEVASASPSTCVVTDVASVKGPLVAEAERVGLGERFVGAHPMAGGTATGAGAADAGLFVGKLVVLTPTQRTRKGAVASIRGLWEATGATVVDMDAAAHDAVVARASHLPQMLVFALCGALAREADVEAIRRLAGSGLRDTTRLATSDAVMWTAIARANRAEILAAMDRFARVWDELRAAVDAGDAGALGRLMEEARTFKESLGGAAS
jgi:prephenate dehydrogenase